MRACLVVTCRLRPSFTASNALRTSPGETYGPRRRLSAGGDLLSHRETLRIVKADFSSFRIYQSLLGRRGRLERPALRWIDWCGLVPSSFNPPSLIIGQSSRLNGGRMVIQLADLRVLLATCDRRFTLILFASLFFLVPPRAL